MPCLGCGLHIYDKSTEHSWVVVSASRHLLFFGKINFAQGSVGQAFQTMKLSTRLSFYSLMMVGAQPHLPRLQQLFFLNPTDPLITALVMYFCIHIMLHLVHIMALKLGASDNEKMNAQAFRIIYEVCLPLYILQMQQLGSTTYAQDIM